MRFKSQFIEMFGNPVTNSSNWVTEKMKKVAPSTSFNGKVEEVDGKFWLLNLDMVESSSGKILDKIYVPKKEIGTSTTTFSPEYVLFSKLRPYLNKVAIPDSTGFATTELIPLKPNPGKLNQVFLTMLLRGDEFLSYISTHVSGTKMPRVTMDIFWDFDVILPPIELQEEFAEFVQQSDKSKLILSRFLDRKQR